MKLLLRQGHVVDPANGLDRVADVFIEKGLIADLGKNLKVRGVKTIDLKGKIVLPGLIDMHVHLREPGREDEETIATGTAAAAAGGFTAVLCMPNTQPVNDNESVTRYIVEKAAAEGSGVRVFPAGAITKGSLGKELAEIGEMVRAGARAVTDDGRPVQNSQVMRRAMEYSRLYDVPVIDHCEDLDLGAKGVMNEGIVSTRLGLRGLSRSAEDAQVARDIVLAELTGARAHIAHISTAGAVEMVRRAKRRKISVTAEVTPHHFTLTDEAVEGYDTNFKMAPPLRTREDVDAVIAGLEDGTIDCIASDHAPHNSNEKMLEFDHAPFGILGLETSVSLVLDRLVHTGKISWSRMVQLMSTRPAQILRLPAGTLSAGAAADVTVLDPDLVHVVDIGRFRSKSRNSPFDGWKLRGRAVMTIVNGRVVWEL